MATGWAAALAPRYAPELRLVGAAQGGVLMNITNDTGLAVRDTMSNGCTAKVLRQDRIAFR